MSRRLTPQDARCRKGWTALAARAIARRAPVRPTCAPSKKLFLLLCLLALAAPCSAQSGPVSCWGNYARDSHNPVAGNNYVAVSSGGYHGVALTADGKLVTWGENIRGQCNAPLGGGFTALAAGLYHNLALRNDGALVAWGDDLRGQCRVPGDRRFRAMAAGSWHSLAIGSDGSLAAWGWNDHGQCDVPPGNQYRSVSAGHTHSVALRTDGSLVAWGSNSDGQCDVPPGHDFVQVAAGSLHNVALRSDGTVVAWGRNYEGQCRAPGGNDFAAVAAGCMHSLALTWDGILVAWGHDDNAQCDVSRDERFAAIAAGGSHSLAIRGRRVTPGEAPAVKAVAQAAKATVSGGPAGTGIPSTADVKPGPEKAVAAQPADSRPATSGEPATATSTDARHVSGRGVTPAAGMASAPPASTARTDAGDGSLRSTKEGAPKQPSSAQPADSAAPLVVKHATADRTVASVPPTGLRAAAPEPRVASLVGSPGAGRPTLFPKPEPNVRPMTKPDSPGVLKGTLNQRADTIAIRPQEQPAARPAVGETLTAKAHALYGHLFEPSHLPAVLSWAGRPIDLIAVVVFGTCVLSIVVLLFRR